MSDDRLAHLPEHLDAAFSNKSFRVAMVVSRYNHEITDKMLSGAKLACTQAGIAPQDIDSFYVPGAFEIPQCIAMLWQRPRWQACIALGAIVRGQTSHHTELAGAIFPMLMQLSCEKNIPLGTGILTVESMQQAVARAGGSRGNKGFEAAVAALDLLHLKLYQELPL